MTQDEQKSRPVRVKKSIMDRIDAVDGGLGPGKFVELALERALAEVEKTGKLVLSAKTPAMESPLAAS